MDNAFGPDGRPRVFYLLRLAHQSLARASERDALARGGPTGVQTGVLFFLTQHGPAQMKDVADGLALNNSAVTGLVDRMEARGLIRRSTSQRDARATTVSVTAKGRRVAAAALPAIRALNSALLEGFSDAEIAVIARFLIGIIERFGDRSQEQNQHDKHRKTP